MNQTEMPGKQTALQLDEAREGQGEGEGIKLCKTLCPILLEREYHTTETPLFQQLTAIEQGRRKL